MCTRIKKYFANLLYRVNRNYHVRTSKPLKCVTVVCSSTIKTIGLSHARPNFGISGVLLSENEAKPVVICCSAGGCYRLVHVVINFADFN